ncbi:flagellin, partial [Vibrio fortis]|uniref:flagellin n=1 Tax=Vibrio fortis TaxID=212667 RepID=UPI002F3FFE51
EGAMNETTNIMQRMRDLSLQSANGSNSKSERISIQEEITALNDELNRIAETTSFGGKKLLNGSFGNTAFQIGGSSGEAVQVGLKSMRTDGIDMGGFSYVANGMADKSWAVSSGNTVFNMSFTDRFGQSQSISINAKAGDDIEQLATYINGQTDQVSASVNEDGQLQIYMAGEQTSGTISFSGSLADELSMSSGRYESVNDIDVTSAGGAQRAVSILDTAMKYVDSHRSELGAMQNRFDHAINNLQNVHENLATSNSRIKDTDYAKETTQMLKQQILQQVSTTILAQAKQAPNLALTLLG